MPSAKYKEIQKQLLDDIKNGKYAEDELIPNEVDLAKELNVSRPTVSHAIRNLVEAGYLERRKKRGTIVKYVKLKQEFTHVIESYNDEIKQNGRVAKTKVLVFEKIKANREVQEALNLEEKSEVYKLVRLRFAENTPVVLVTTFLPAQNLPDFDQHDFNQESLYDVLKSYQLAVTHVQRKLEVKLAGETNSNFLNIESSDPVFYFHTIGSTKAGLKIEYSIATYRGDNNYFMIDLDQNNED